MRTENCPDQGEVGEVCECAHVNERIAGEWLALYPVHLIDETLAEFPHQRTINVPHI